MNNKEIITDATGGKKSDSGKLRYDLLEPEFLQEVVAVLTHGATKYGDRNWSKVQNDRYFAALYRHIEAMRLGEKRDSETGLHHAAHAACSLMFLYYNLVDDISDLETVNTCACDFCFEYVGATPTQANYGATDCVCTLCVDEAWDAIIEEKQA